MKLYARTSALPAIAAALALSSTTVLAQQAQPVTTDPPPASTTTDQAAPATEPAPTAADTSAVAPADATATPISTKSASKAATKTVKRTSRTVAKPVAAAKPVATTHVASRSVATHATLPAATSPVAPSSSVPVTDAQNSQSAVKPLVDVNANPAPTKSAAATPAKKHDDTLPIAGGALAFLAVGGAAVALTRRRHDEEDEWADEGTIEHQPATDDFADEVQRDQVVHDEEPAMLAPAASAFSWNGQERSSELAPASESSDERDDRRPGETWIQRAYRGPTPNNPSVSLRARLKRAAFFDKRERDVAAGTAKPVDMDAGLPEAMVEEQERELA